MTSLTRRELLALFGLGAIGATLPSTLGALPRTAPTRLTPFDLRDVRLTDGPFRDAQVRNARYLLALNVDRMLHNFRTNAGLASKAPVYGGWESEEPWVNIRCHGHTLGHYLSAVAMHYAATGDRVFKDRSDYIVAELQACQRARGDGLVTAFPDGAKPLEDAIAGRRWNGVPWYTMHKIFAGLRDAHLYAESPGALPTLVALSEWTWSSTRAMTDTEMQHMLDTEHGGMTEVLADVSALAHEPKFLALARRFAHRKVLDPLAEGRDVLDGLHSNTQIPKFVGFQRVHELDGSAADSAAYGAAARHFWDTVATRRAFATGGNGDNEHFFPVAEFARHLDSAKTMETCCTHNMLRLTRALHAEAPSSEYADYYERALYNGILASQDPISGMNTYFQATRPGYVRLYHTPDESFWCCTGTAMENHAKYGDSIYFHDADSVYVNLFIPSTVTWRERGFTLTQTTRFPDADTTRLTVEVRRPTRTTIHVRRPGWCDAMTVTVNGQPVRVAATAAGYVPVAREWRSGDVVEVRLPMTLRGVPMPGAPEYVAFAYGPIVLAGRLGTEGVNPEQQVIKNERESGNMLNVPVDVPTLVAPRGVARDVAQHVRAVRDQSLTFETVGLGRPRDVVLVPFHRLSNERYNLYWKVELA